MPKRGDAQAEAMLKEQPGEWRNPYQQQDALEDVGKLLDDVDHVRHERDILLVVNHALEFGGVKSMADFAGWLDRNMDNLQRSGMGETPSVHAPPTPKIALIANYLRWVQRVQAERAERGEVR